MTFQTEADFEAALVRVLKSCGWNDAGGVLEYPTEQDLIDNWASILFDTNKDRDRLNNQPLTQGEMDQLLEQVKTLRTPAALNGFINGKTVAITRDNPNDPEHLGKEVSLKIYDRKEIASGQSRYQIARQPKFSTASKMLNQRRGDLTLLINGMPLIHIELKRTGVALSEATNQIAKYAHEGVFTGLFSLVQIFVAMRPDEAVYFANPGPDGSFANTNHHFHWGNFDNEPVNDWAQFTRELLSIPMAHQLIGFYCVADGSDGVLKVMRSYQYHAVSKIWAQVAKANKTDSWGGASARGGYVWHTTGSGKTMTSFKAAQLIVDSNEADKVVFLVDRIELGDQSLREYRAFANQTDDVHKTEDTNELRECLKCKSDARLIVTSIQKMSNVAKDAGFLTARDMEDIRSQRMVFIVDECHRSTFGEMMLDIRAAFPEAMFFGFTGTPIHEENGKKNATTSMVFGNELHRYIVADGIRDGNVLGFDPYMVLTFRDEDVRTQVALHEVKAGSVDEVANDPKRREEYLRIHDLPMAGGVGEDGSYSKGVEDYVPEAQYSGNGEEPAEHQRAVVRDIAEGWNSRSRLGRFHAIFATRSIPEAITYYRLLRDEAPQLRVTALFDPNIDNTGGAIYKEDGLVEILSDYNEQYGTAYTIPTHAQFKQDVSARLAHKKPYMGIDRKPECCIDLLVVVDQMLTGFDSKWVNTLYLDKVLHYEGLIQAFSRTNRLFDPRSHKPFGTICYYRRPHTMAREIEAAFRLYSGDRPYGLFADKLPENITMANALFSQIEGVFATEGIEGFERLPDDVTARGKFAMLFKDMSDRIEAARLQGFTWERTDLDPAVALTEETYQVLLQRYKELRTPDPVNPFNPWQEVPFDIDPYLTQIDTGRIDADYMNSHFVKWVKTIANQGSAGKAAQDALDALHRSFALLNQEEQRCASLFISDVQSGEIVVEEGKTFRDYLNSYMHGEKERQIDQLVELFGIDRELIVPLMAGDVTESNIDDFGRMSALEQTVDAAKAKAYFEKKEGTTVSAFKARVKARGLIRQFVLEGGFDIE